MTCFECGAIVFLYSKYVKVLIKSFLAILNIVSFSWFIINSRHCRSAREYAPRGQNARAARALSVAKVSPAAPRRGGVCGATVADGADPGHSWPGHATAICWPGGEADPTGRPGAVLNSAAGPDCAADPGVRSRAYEAVFINHKQAADRMNMCRPRAISQDVSDAVVTSLCSLKRLLINTCQNKLQNRQHQRNSPSLACTADEL